MPNVTMSSLIGDIRTYAYNPTGIQSAIFNALEAATDGTMDIVDPSNPFVFSLSATAATVAAFMQENESRTRRLYPSVATTNDDLYLHMSDKDYVDRFAVPSKVTFTVIIQKASLLDILVNEPITNNGVAIIPRNTIFTVANVNFSLQYPVEIRQLVHGGLQITYLNDKPSPLKGLDSNLVIWSEFSDATLTQWIKLDLEMDQFNINTVYQDVSTSAGFVTTVDMKDQFYYIRCYLQNATTGKWNEILTTHSDQVYDPLTVTAVVKVLDSQVRVTIPVIYTSKAMVSGKLRIDIYETKGVLNLQLGDYASNEYTAKWYSVDTNDDTLYSTAIRQVTNILFFSQTHVNSGRDALTFSDLKTRMINNSVGSQILPITNTQLASSMTDLGYDITKNIDTLTNRVFLASRYLPNPTDASILTPVTSTMLTTTVTMNQATDWVGAFDNGESITLTSRTLYRYKNGVTTPVTNAELTGINSQPLLERCNTITKGGYFYSPFSYVLDASTDVFETRAYYLDAPDVLSRNFILANETTGLQASISTGYSVVRTQTGYDLYIETQSSDAYKALNDSQVGAQLSLVSPNQAKRVSVLGTLYHVDATTKERTFRFSLQSNFNVDALDQMEFPGIPSVTNGLIVKLALQQSTDLLLTTTADLPTSYVYSDADILVDQTLYRNTVPAVLSQERLTVEFGYALKSLWAQCRSSVSSIPSEVYPANVTAYYDNNVYQLDPATGAHFSVVSGVLTYNILHHKGDPVLDSAGQPVIKYRAGEVRLDANGQPVPLSGFKRFMIRYIDVMMFSGVYYFTTDATTQAYLASLMKDVVTWMTTDIPGYQNFLLEQTRIYFHPKVTAGMVRVIDSDNNTVFIDSAQNLALKLYVPARVFNDTALRKTISQSTVKALSTLLQDTVVSVSSIKKALRELYKDDVIDVELSGLGGTTNPQSVVTVFDEQARLALGKRLVALEDNTLLVEEAVTIAYLLHGVR
jgi:hypothetical protein